MVHFVGAGSGAVDLITVRGSRLLSEADVVIYAGSLVNPDLLCYTKEGCEIHNSATMTLEQVIEVIKKLRETKKQPFASIRATAAFTARCGSSSTRRRSLV